MRKAGMRVVVVSWEYAMRHALEDARANALDDKSDDLAAAVAAVLALDATA